MSLPAFRRFSTACRLIVENPTNFFGAKQTTALGEDSALAVDPAQPRHRGLVANGIFDSAHNTIEYRADYSTPLPFIPLVRKACGRNR